MWISWKEKKEIHPKLLWETECKEEDAVDWASNLAQNQEVYLQAVLGEDKIIWGNWNP
jgi:hypothetical protein